MAVATAAVGAVDRRPINKVPNPFPLTLAGMLAALGPQAINFGISIGGGEAYLLPNVSARGTLHMHWLMTVSVILETALLSRGERVVANDDVRGKTCRFGADLPRLALPHPRVRVGRPALLDHATGDDAGGRLDQRRKLLQRVVGVEARARLIEADQERALGWLSGIDHPDSVAGSGSAAVGSIQRTSPSRRNQVICRRE